MITSLLEFGSSIAKNLESEIRAVPSWRLQGWSQKNVIDLLLPLTRHVKADGAGRERRKAALNLLTMHGDGTWRNFFGTQALAKNYFTKSHISRVVPKLTHTLIPVGP